MNYLGSVLNNSVKAKYFRLLVIRISIAKMKNLKSEMYLGNLDSTTFHGQELCCLFISFLFGFGRKC